MAATITPESVWAHIPPRARDSHKGSFGAVLVVAGSACYRGAASLAVEGALRTGAGIVPLARVAPVLAAVSATRPWARPGPPRHGSWWKNCCPALAAARCWTPTA